MKKLIAMTLLLGGSTLLCAQKTVKIPAVYKPVKSEMYKKGWIDFDAGPIADGETIDDAAKRLLQLVIEVAGGKQTKAEEKGFREISIFKDGVVL